MTKQSLGAREADQLAESITRVLTKEYPIDVLALVVRKLNADVRLMQKSEGEAIVKRAMESRIATESIEYLKAIEADQEVFGSDDEDPLN